MKRILMIVLGCFLVVTTVDAASFDCVKAATNTEKLICSNSALSKLDEELSAAYKMALKDEKQTDSIKQVQKQWIKERNGCSNVSCLKDEYTARIAQLSLANKTDQSRGEMKSDAVACQTIGDYANRGELAKLYVPVDEKIQPKIESLFGQLSGSTTLWLTDLDNDGVPDPFIINVDGTAHISNGHAISGKDANVIVDIDSSESDLALLAVNGKYYVLTSNGSDLKELLHMTRESFEPVCKFIQRNKPFIEITKGKDNPVCNAASSGNVKHISFKPVDNKTVLNEEVITGLATADINNDGKPEKIALVDYESGAGRGSSSLMIRAIDNENPKRADRIKKILARTFDGSNVKQGVFVYDGLTYIDEASTGVLLIRNGNFEEVCHFKFRPLFDVEDSGQHFER